MFRQFYRVMDEATDGEGGGGAGGAALGGAGDEGNTGGTGNTSTNDTPPDGGTGGDPLKEFWGDVTPKFPEGFPDEYKTNPNLKPFVTKEGELNVNNMFKSYLHTKSMVGAKDLVKLPGENSTEEERAEFFQKLGHVKDLKEYKVDLPEGSKVAPEFVDKMKEVLHKNFVPPKVANELVKFLNEQTSTAEKTMQEANTAKAKQYNETLQKEYGEAFTERANMAKKLLVDTLGKDSEDLKLFNDPLIGSNPTIFKLLTKLAESAYAEDRTALKPGGGTGKMTPSEAQAEINRIYGDKDDAFHKPTHPSYKDRTAYMQSLFKMKNLK